MSVTTTLESPNPYEPPKHLITSSAPGHVGYFHVQRVPAFVYLFLGAALAFACIEWPGADKLLWVLLLLIAILTIFGWTTGTVLKIKDEGERLRIWYGPVPVIQKAIPYIAMDSIEIGSTRFRDFWKMGFVPGWIRKRHDCVVVNLIMGRVRIGSNDAENLARFLQTKIGERK